MITNVIFHDISRVANHISDQTFGFPDMFYKNLYHFKDSVSNNVIRTATVLKR